MIDLPYLFIPILAWLSAQVIKFALVAAQVAVNFKLLYASGGMPSAHTAAIVAITTTIGIREGVDTAIFGLAFTCASIIIYDALGVRRASGIQAIAIRLLLETSKHPLPDELGRAKGHTPAEVVAGGLWGLLLAYLLSQ